MGISIVINTFNSARKIAQVIDSVSNFDEVLVCDMNSSDNTLEIAKAKGCRTLSCSFPGAISADPARNIAIEATTNDWVFVVDSDELIPAALREHLYKFIQNPSDIKGLLIPRRNFIMHIFKRSSYPDYQLRFFHKKSAYWPTEPFSTPEIKGRINRIPAARKDCAIIHMPCTFTEGLRKINLRSSGNLRKFREAGIKITLPRIMFEPLGVFLSTYFLKGAVRYGVPGFISACHDATYRYFQLAKLYEETIHHLVPGAGELLKDQTADLEKELTKS